MSLCTPRDRVLYYAARWQRIFAAAELTSPPDLEEREPDDRWPWVARVQPYLLIPDLERAPRLDRAKIDSLSVRSKSHIRLTGEQYRAGVAGLAEAAVDRGEPFAALKDLTP